MATPSLAGKYPPPAVIDGIDCYAPHLLEADTGYDSTHHRELAQLEAGNWWFRSRNRLILDAITTWFPGLRSYLEIGCGTGYVLSAVATALPNIRLVGSEPLISGLAQTRNRLPATHVIQADATDLPFQSVFDVIGAFDVVEHIEDDAAALKNMYEAVVPGGGIVLTVPQHPWLWSLADEQAHHVRRYTRSALIEVVTGAGFEVLRTTSFVSLLVPLMVASRAAGRDRWREQDPYREFRLSPTVNSLLESVMTFERRWLGSADLPVGGSRLLVARRPAFA